MGAIATCSSPRADEITSVNVVMRQFTSTCPCDVGKAVVDRDRGLLNYSATRASFGVTPIHSATIAFVRHEDIIVEILFVTRV